MATETSKLRVGLFVLATGTVFAIVVLVFGAGRLFSQRLRLVTFFDHSVQGLEVGATVKYRGVLVGRVTRIVLAKGGELVRVDMEVDPEDFVLESGTAPEDREAASQDLFNTAVAAGLRSSLQYVGITGLKCVQLDYIAEPTAVPPPEPTAPEPFLFVPSGPSALAQIETSVSTTLQQLAQVDFPQIGAELQSLLQSGNRLLTDARMEQTLTELADSSQAFRRLVTRIEGGLGDPVIQDVKRAAANIAALSADLRETLARLDQFMENEQIAGLQEDLAAAADGARRIVNRVEAELDAMDAAALIRELHAAVQEIARAAATVRSVRPELQRGLHELSLTLTGVRRLVETVDQDPSVLIRGRSEPEPEPWQEGQ